MTELLTAAQMRDIEQAAIKSGQVTGLELMERAGRGVVEAIFEEWPELAKTSGKAVVLCGPGNNGGDGFVVARLLKEWGWEVDVFVLGRPEKLPPDALTNYERWCALDDSSVTEMSRLADARISGKCQLFEADIVVDALFGTGLTRPLGSAHNEVWEAFDLDTGAINRMVAIDVPSGLCADSGRVLSELERTEDRDPHRVTASKIPFHATQAELSVTFHRAKTGHLLSDSANTCGKLVIKDIGLGSNCASWKNEFVTAGAVSADHLAKGRGVNKFSHGHALILSGAPGKTGAARLAARGALRIGAGLVTLGIPPAAQLEVAAQVTAIMLQRVDGAEALSDILRDERMNALCFGPGLGLARARALAPVALAAGRPTVLDADGLTAFADDPSVLFGMLHEGCVLTPHGGEFARLFPDIAAKLNAIPTKGPAFSKVDATREAAERAGCVVLFKGPDTVIAAPDERCSISSAFYDRSAPWLATAGSGDVLAGFITGLLARGFDAMAAAETAAWLHVECALTFGPGLIAEDLPEQLPKVLKELNI